MTRRLRYLVLSRFVMGNPRRWLYYTVGMVLWRQFRKFTGNEPEILYRGRFGPGHRLDLLTARPLPGRFQTRRRRRAVAADALAELRRLTS